MPPKPSGKPRRRWRWILAILAIPGLFFLLQGGHRVLDALGSAPVRSVRVLDGSAALPAVADSGFSRALSALAEIDLEPGNQVELLIEGPETLGRIEKDIQEARQSVAFQSYFCETGTVADRLKTLLIAKARQGVEVLFLRDGFGCNSLGGSYSDSLTDGGVEVAVVRPLHWYSFHKAQHRSHVRAIVVDGRIGYTGGFGIADKWLPRGDTAGWRETTVRFTGPAVTRLAGSFAIAWSEATGHLLADGRFHASPAQPRDGVVAGILFTVRQYGTPVPERYMALSLAGARQRVYITNPYFIPNRELRAWLIDAVRRKVDVRVLTTGANVDVRWTRWASRSRYEELLKAGVRIYEYEPAMLHAKTMVIDGVSSSVGSLNLDNVSLRINDEVVLLVQDRGFGASLDSLFLDDLTRADEISLEQFRRRPLIEKLREPFARMLRDFL